MNVLDQPFKNVQIALNAKLKLVFILSHRVYFRLKVLHVLHDQFQIASIVFLHLSVVVNDSNQKLLFFETIRD